MIQALQENRGLKDSVYGLSKENKDNKIKEIFFKGLCLTFNYQLEGEVAGMVTASQLLCGNVICTWQAQGAVSCCL